MKTERAAIAAAALALALLGGCAGGGGRKGRTPVLGERIPILVSENEAKVDPALAGVAIALPAAEANDSWTQSGGAPDKVMGNLALGQTVTRAWSATIKTSGVTTRLGAAPVIADNKLFVVDTDAVVHAYAADTGGQLWTAPLATDKKSKVARFGGGVSYDDGKVYATDGLGDVVALNAADGKELWRKRPGGPLRGAPTVDDDQIYVLSQDNQLFALTQADGTILWTQSGSLESQGVFGVAAPAVARGTVVAGFSSGELNAYRYENGRTLWADALSRSSMSTSVSSLADIDADPVIDETRVYALGQGGRMVAVNLATGERVWEQNFAGISTPWLAGEWLFVVTDDSRLYCLARATGKVRWVAQLRQFRKVKKRKGAAPAPNPDADGGDAAPRYTPRTGPVGKGPLTWYGPVLAGGRLVLTNSLGDIIFVSPNDGTIGTTVTGKQPFTLGPVVANNMLYVLDSKGRLTAYK